jgi:DNA replication protein DnaC
MRVGNQQITHVLPEITQADLMVEFGTDIFFKRCKWAREQTELFEHLRKAESGYIFGATRCGKTVFMKAKALEIGNSDKIFKSSFVKFVNFGKLVNDLGKDNWAYKNFIIEELRQATHLFIDDIGTEMGTTWHEQVLTELLDNRLFKMDKDGEKKTTSFSSNKRPDELPYHPRVIARILDMGKVTQVYETDEHKQRTY